MKCQTDSETMEWLRERLIPHDPYRGAVEQRHYIQFYPPARYRQQDAFIRHFYERIIPGTESLIHMTDWSLYQPSDMSAIDAIRSDHSENRMLVDSPGHVLEASEKELGVSLLALSTSFAWSSYLYSPHHRSTLYNWEGEIFDFWTDSTDLMSEMMLIMRDFELSETKQANQQAHR